VSSSRKEKRIVESKKKDSSSSGPNLNMGLGEVNELISMLFKAFRSLRLTPSIENGLLSTLNLVLVTY